MKNKLKGVVAHDTRWQTHIDAVSDMLAILHTIEQEGKVIQVQAARANPREVAVNLERICEEVAALLDDVQRLRESLAAFQATVIDDIYRAAEGKPAFRLARDGFTYVAHEGDQGAEASRRKEGSDDQDKG